MKHIRPSYHKSFSGIANKAYGRSGINSMRKQRRSIRKGTKFMRSVVKMGMNSAMGKQLGNII